MPVLYIEMKFSLCNIFQLMENGASLMMKNKCEILSDEDWGFDKTTVKLVVGFQGLNFQSDEDDTCSGVSFKLSIMSYHGIRRIGKLKCCDIFYLLFP